jgi:hypothetical protein
MGDGSTTQALANEGVDDGKAVGEAGEKVLPVLSSPKQRGLSW